jgi:two-component system chemotaxis response regulator CheB
MFSTLTERGASTTFDALAAGASDYVLKPSTSTGETLEQVVGSSLVPKIIALTRSRFGAALQAAMAAVEPVGLQKTPRLGPASPAWTNAPSSFGKGQILSPLNKPPPAASLLPTTVNKPGMSIFQRVETGTVPKNPFPEAVTTKTSIASPSIAARAGAGASLRPSMSAAGRKPIQIIAIASSTGGPNALAEILPRLPSTLPVPVVIVQHMPPIFTRCLADRLSARCELKVKESAGGERLMAGHVYIAPGNHHLELVREGDAVSTVLTDGPPENSCRPAADVMLRSVVRAYGGAALCVVLTGMGQDGLRGARELHEAGGRLLVQSGPTCVIWGMPKVVEEAGLAEAVVPLPELAAAILQRVGSGLLQLRPPEKAR